MKFSFYSLKTQFVRYVQGVVIGGTLLATPSVFAAYPDRPITIVVPYPTGGSSDSVARILTPMLAKRLKQSLIVENSSGAGGSIGTVRTVRAASDGYTLLLGSGSEVLINKLINPQVAYDGLYDLAPIAMIGTAPMVVLGKADLPAKTISDVLALARATPSELNYASAGHGTIMHLTGELLKMRANVEISHVPYRGSPPALNDLMGGQVDLAISTLSAAQGAIRSNKVKVFAVTSKTPSELAPNIPALGMAPGLEGFDVSVWFALFAPAKTPPAILRQLEEAVVQVINDPVVKKQLAGLGVTAHSASAEQLRAFLAAEAEKYRVIVKSANITTGQ